MNVETPVFDFTDYRSFLKSYFKRKREKKREFSLRLWAQKLGINGPSALSMILNGTRHPGFELLDRLIDYFRFSNQEAKYFKYLVKLAKVNGNSEKTVSILKELQNLHPEKEFQLLDADIFDAMSNWYYFALRELTATKELTEDYNWISKRLNRKVPPIEIKRAIEKMLELGILKRSKTGKLFQADEQVMTTTDIASEALKQFHHQMMNLAQESLREVLLDHREITGVTLNVDPKKIELAKKLIREFRNSFSKLIGENYGEEVYQLNIQFFPLTKLQQRGNA